jgi:pimeloyl-ACP methyl ester carboxylesterase
MFGYIWTFHLPVSMVKFLGTGGNLAFIRGVHTAQQDPKDVKLYVAESLACTLGPSELEFVTQDEGTLSFHRMPKISYTASVLERGKDPAASFWEQTSYYRHGVAHKPWKKSLETIAELYSLGAAASESSSPARRRSSSSASSALLNSTLKGVLNAPATVLWGMEDVAMTREVCLDGLGDYLAKDSEVVLLPRSGHWTPLEPDSRAALAKVIGMYAGGIEGEFAGSASVTKVVSEVYTGAVQYVKK